MAFLEITLDINPADRGAAVAVYERFRQPFLDSVRGARSKQLLVRDDDVQVLHGFESTAAASDYLASELFTADVVGALSSLLNRSPDVRIYEEH